MSDYQQTVSQLLHLLTFDDAQIDVVETETEVSVSLTLSPEDSGTLIGYHGEKIDALQLLLSLMYNHGHAHFIPVRLDINGYRERRSQSLEELADKAASQSLISGREIILPPLTAAERRLIHLHLGTRADISTYSEGEGRNRRLIIRPQPNKTNAV